jgi:3-hydroxybutyryl-CoA dehydrogenase
VRRFTRSDHGSSEIIPGLATSRNHRRTREFAENSASKWSKIAQDEPSALWSTDFNSDIYEPRFCHETGPASIEDIDKNCKIGLNHPMGPLALANFVEPRQCWISSVSCRRPTTGDANTGLRLLVKGNMSRPSWLGRKTGQGFYD